MNDIEADCPDLSRLDGRVAVVTGAGSRGAGIGNGKAAAVLLARRGAKLLLLDADEASAQITRRLIESSGGQALVRRTDVSSPEACRAAMDAAVQAWDRVDILVNNVGIGGPAGDAVELDLDEWDSALRVNVTSMMLMG